MHSTLAGSRVSLRGRNGPKSSVCAVYVAPPVPSSAANGSRSTDFISQGNAFLNALKPIKRINGLFRCFCAGRSGTGEKKERPLREIKGKDVEMLNHSIIEVRRDSKITWSNPRSKNIQPSSHYNYKQTLEIAHDYVSAGTQTHRV